MHLHISDAWTVVQYRTPYCNFGQHFNICLLSTNTISRVISGLSPLPCCLTEGGTLFNTDESPESAVYPVGGKVRGRGPPPLSLDTITHTCLMPFPLNWGKFQTDLLRLSHPVLCNLLRERARRREKKKKSGLGADLKTQLLVDVLHVSKTQGHTIKYLPKSCTRSLCGGGRVCKERVFENDSKASAQQYIGALSHSGLWMVTWRERKTLPFFPTCPQFNWVIIWASIESFSVTDASCNSFNALGSWGSICICMIGLHNK